MKSIFPATGEEKIVKLAERRVAKIFQPYLTNGADVEAATLLLKTLRPSESMKVLKTWLNGWATSKRMSEDPFLPCLFGCSEEIDSLSHYIQCPMLLSLIVFLVGECSVDPLIRIGIKRPSTSCLIIQSCLFSGYHAVKAQARAGMIPLHEDVRTTANRIAWSTFAETFSAEAGECGIKCYAFTLTKFIDFIINSRHLTTEGLCKRVHFEALALPDRSDG